MRLLCEVFRTDFLSLKDPTGSKCPKQHTPRDNLGIQTPPEVLPIVEGLTYLWVLFTSKGKMVQEIDRRINVASAVNQTCTSLLWLRESCERKGSLPTG